MTRQATSKGVPQTEKQFQEAVIELAKLNGWMVYHTHDSRRSEPGFPDLVLVKNGFVIFAELKTEKGRVSEAQEKWLRNLGSGEGCFSVFLWRPKMWDGIARTLARRG